MSAPPAPHVSLGLKAFFIVGMLVTGSLNTISKSAQNRFTHQNDAGETVTFSYPWTQTLVMFVGESLVLLFFLFQRHQQRRARLQALDAAAINKSTEIESYLDYSEEGDSLIVKPINPPQPKTNWKSPFYLLVPSICDLIGTTLAGIGLLYVSASVWQMVRGSIIVFTTILSAVFLKQKKYRYHWVGLAIVVVGISVVGSATLLQNSASANGAKTLLGLLLVIAGQFMSATQMIVEELFLKSRGFEPAQVVGFEGLWGVVIMLAFVLPLLAHIPGDDNGVYENALEAADLAVHNGSLMAFIIVYLFSIAFYNFFGLSVAKALTSVHRTLIDALRTTLVWGVELVLCYAIGSEWGEPWSRYSPLQLAGFVLLLFGTLIYNHVLKFNVLEPNSL